MKVFEAIYSMGGIATGGFFRSLVVAHTQKNVRGLLNEQHDEDVSNLRIEESDIDASVYPHEQVLTTIFA
ncbi:hypothetical protein JOC94_002350 [Bacillus thermophilus]|uniref:Uncharacterized protein n=1 Tax=Siminovitchia thermophila TaxID=1245522 RepID=A0ABS2R933_9BACI|nr:hypothetical protein [Siminovitchia thermophila]MBM7715363.1 hypothetical protein [Siminovitchia thermophila]